MLSTQKKKVFDLLLEKKTSNTVLKRIEHQLVNNEAPNDLQPLLVNLTQGARRLGVCRTHFFNLRKRGIIPTVQLGDSEFVRVSDLDTFVANLNQTYRKEEAKS